MNLELAAAGYRERFGEAPRLLAVAPGRVNLIGEHTDYNDGFVMPAAINLSIYVAAGPTSGPSRLISKDRGEAPPFDVADLAHGQLTGWAAYSGGMAWALREWGTPPRTNLQAFVASNLPIGAGVSSSAAMELAFGALWNHQDGLGLSPKDLAHIGKLCENRYVGVSSGIMDQMACALGKKDSALFLDTRSLEASYAPIPSGLRVVLCDTRHPRTLASSAYNERVEECARAAAALNVAKLRDADLAMLEKTSESLDEIAYRRARHVITENARCQGFAAALASGNRLKIEVLMRASHESLRDDYEVTGPQLDAMAEACWEASGCVGARMTGAGFGGACVALVDETKIDDFMHSADNRYRSRHPGEPAFLVCTASDGVRIVEP